MDSWDDWASDVFGAAELGDVRRSNRLAQMAAQAGRHPSGRVSDVFEADAERQGAYDFIESSHVSTGKIRRAITQATARRCQGEPWVYVPLDGTSLKLWDGTGNKDFGAIGTYRSGAMGLKLYNAMAVSPAGVPIGVAAQVWWRRPRQRTPKRHHNSRAVYDKETRYLLECIEQVCEAFAEQAPTTRCWFQIDRGGESQFALRALQASGHWFTVRGQATRLIRGPSERLQPLRRTLSRQPVLGHVTVSVSGNEDRPARTARVTVQATTVEMRLREKRTKRKSYITLNAVLVREVGFRKGSIEWLLLTNRPVRTFAQALKVVDGYTYRWRIEEFHKTWKTGACNVENMQLHCSDRAIRWATILSAVAARIERLKYLARTEPNTPASAELTSHEIKALVLLHTKTGKYRESVVRNLSIGEAVLWIAQLGGYTGKSSGGPPGSITIARGLERLEPAAQLLTNMEKMR